MSKNVTTKAGKFIADLRTINGDTKLSMSKKIGTSQSYISKIEHGRLNVSKKYYKIICDTYNLDEYKREEFQEAIISSYSDKVTKVGKFLRKLRWINDESNLIMSKKLGISRPHLSRLERGGLLISDKRFNLICEIYNLDRDQIHEFEYALKLTQYSDISKVGKIIRQIRINNNESISDMANKIGYTKEYIESLERGKKPLSINIFMQICEVYEPSNQIILELEKNIKIKNYSDTNEISIFLRKIRWINNETIIDMAYLLNMSVQHLLLIESGKIPLSKKCYNLIRVVYDLNDQMVQELDNILLNNSLHNIKKYVTNNMVIKLTSCINKLSDSDINKINKILDKY